VVQAAFYLGLAAWMALAPQAAEEYVNPSFCFRIVKPSGTAATTLLPNDGGLSMQVGKACPGDGCIVLTAAAGYVDASSTAGQAHADFERAGWVVQSTGKRTLGGLGWDRFGMSRGSERLTLFEHMATVDQATYVVSVRYGAEQAGEARKAVDGLLASWRRVSACK
jgi:hypothetical protein